MEAMERYDIKEVQKECDSLCYMHGMCGREKDGRRCGTYKMKIGKGIA